MNDDTPMTAHQSLSAHAMVARLDSAIRFALAHNLVDDEPWLRDSRDYLQIFIENSGQAAIKFIPLIEPQLSDFEKAAAMLSSKVSSSREPHYLALKRCCSGPVFGKMSGKVA